jgi:hypothetical protein
MVIRRDCCGEVVGYDNGYEASGGGLRIDAGCSGICVGGCGGCFCGFSGVCGNCTCRGDGGKQGNWWWIAVVTSVYAVLVEKDISVGYDGGL